MNNKGDAVIYRMLRQTNKHRVCDFHTGTYLSSHPGNPTNISSYKYCGWRNQPGDDSQAWEKRKAMLEQCKNNKVPEVTMKEMKRKKKDDEEAEETGIDTDELVDVED